MIKKTREVSAKPSIFLISLLFLAWFFISDQPYLILGIEDSNVKQVGIYCPDYKDLNTFKGEKHEYIYNNVVKGPAI